MSIQSGSGGLVDKIRMIARSYSNVAYLDDFGIERDVDSS